MKLTPTEIRAFARAKTLTPISDADRAALPADSDTWTPHQRRQVRETRLVLAAAALDARDLHNSLYRLALKTDDAQAKRDYRVTALDTSTARLRSALIDAYRQLLDLDATPLFPYVPRTPRALR